MWSVTRYRFVSESRGARKGLVGVGLRASPSCEEYSGSAWIRCVWSWRAETAVV